jgi:limonene 1,2-monooxygenase
MALPARMRFGIFLAPFHRVGENPTLGIERDLELVQWLDTLGFDEAWIGEHHSAGWETIASPEIFIATAAERTRHIKLGTGVVSLPYHHPLMVANRIVLLDHLTRGRVMLGVGPGALVTDALMLGIEPARQRPMMDEALDVIMRLFTDPTPFTYTTDWFEIHDAVLQLRPYTQPHPPLAPLSDKTAAPCLPATIIPAGDSMLATASGQRGKVDLRKQWAIAEEAAEKAGKAMRREEWRLVVQAHLAETREEALEEVRKGAGRFVFEYTHRSLGRPVPPGTTPDTLIDEMVENGGWIVGTPDDCIAAIHRLDEITEGFGGLLISTNEWAPRSKVLKSYELMARYVLPRFQGSLLGIETSNAWSVTHSEKVSDERIRALETAHRAYEVRRS